MQSESIRPHTDWDKHEFLRSEAAAEYFRWTTWLWKYEHYVSPETSAARRKIVQDWNTESKAMNEIAL